MIKLSDWSICIKFVEMAYNGYRIHISDASSPEEIANFKHRYTGGMVQLLGIAGCLPCMCISGVWRCLRVTGAWQPVFFVACVCRHIGLNYSKNRQKMKLFNVIVRSAVVVIVAGAGCAVLYKTVPPEMKTRLKVALTVDVDRVESEFRGKSIMWVGTSIPTDDYPYIVGKILDADVRNVSKGCSMVRGGYEWGVTESDSSGWHDVPWQLVAYSLSLSSAEKDAFIEYSRRREVRIYDCSRSDGSQIEPAYDEGSLEQWRNSSYDRIFAENLSGVDYVFIDHGFNDSFNEGAECFRDGDVTSRDRRSFYGGMNFVIDRIKEINPECEVVIVSHYTRNQIHDGRSESMIWECQRRLAEYRGLRFVDVSDRLPFTRENIKEYMPDGLHPGSDRSNRVSVMIAESIVAELTESAP